MWILDPQRKVPIPEAQLYVTLQEARWLRDAMIKLIADPEALEHEHLGDGAELSIAIVTKRKLATGAYTPLERELLRG